jgi:hypothetical protein
MEIRMTLVHARLGLAATAAVALISAAAVLPASAQSKTYPAGTDCTKMVGNSKTDCEHQMKNTASPDNANNPDNASINTSNSPTYEQQPIGTPDPGANSPASTTYPSGGEDCTKLVGNSKTDCMNRAIQNGSNDDSNNPDQQN